MWINQDVNIYVKFLESHMIADCHHVILDTGLRILDRKNGFLMFTRHQATSNRHHFASNNGLLFY